MDEQLLLLKVEDAARRLGISRSRAYELVRSGDLPSVKVGGLLRVPAAELDRWVEANLNKVTGR